ncbi:hypothetical protein ZHAS_00021691 [Anopheles sinensis]|uniref:Ionotropic glutamate receptor L-glutamate and glycine-binding domain-containing protein n=1 Tax=Anopheles sinensis TaxID=74873 RepID=A0A084WT34_ANOSI|nr:hypothetical protein ZHAS_00021691 [Anopheles sinensis]
MFAFHGIPYWSVTGHREAFYMHYTTQLAAALQFHTVACDFDHAFGTQRVLPLKDVRVTALFIESFPYTYLQGKNNLLGLDLFIFRPILTHLKSDTLYKPLKVERDGGKMMHDLVSKLDNAEVDFLLTRRTVAYGDFSSIYIPENIFLCIVVPRPFRVDLISSLMRPFDNSVWIALGTALVVLQLKKLLIKSNNHIGKALATLERHNKWQTFSTITAEWISFILIESYLAQVTCFFLDFRFQPDPQTLEQFFATNVPIRLPEDQKPLLELIDPAVAEAIERRAVAEEACTEFSADCAHLDMNLRATYIINNYQTIDPSAGAKRSYILTETIFSQPSAYVFARGSQLRDLFAVYLQRLLEAGIVQWHVKGMNSYIMPPQIQYEEALQFEHLTSIWLFIVVGWAIAFIIFLMELVFEYFKIFSK